MLAPGAILLGNRGACYECGHEHGAGDRCVSFHYTPEFMEDVVAAVPGAKRLAFDRTHLPPSVETASLVAEAMAARETADAAALEEVAVRLAGAAASAGAGGREARALGSRDERRVAGAVRHIEASADQPLALGDLARGAGVGRYHFLRIFRAVTGMTPYQYVLFTRMQRAALRLRSSAASVAAIAFEAGFNDLSTFNRRFRRVMGTSPKAYRGVPREPDRPFRRLG
jgi:AraC-like DNA-binding protein